MNLATYGIGKTEEDPQTSGNSQQGEIAAPSGKAVTPSPKEGVA